MIDLHMHTTASDGRLTPAELVARAAAAGLTTISVTDHDTVAAIAEVTAAAKPSGIRVVPGIEITAIDQARDVHMLGYFFDPASEGLGAFLVGQRALRVSRVREIAARLSTLNMFIDVDALLMAAAARPGTSVGRPQIARALVRAGHVPSVQDAFDSWLATGRPAYVPRTGPSPADVVKTIHDAGGVASFAHPGVTRRDELIAPLVDSGLDAIEVFHSDHSVEDTTAYQRVAARYGILVSGGSDFHGEDPSFAKATEGRPHLAKATEGRPHLAKATEGRPDLANAAGARPTRAQRARFGAVTLPQADFDALESRSSAYAGDARGTTPR